MAQTTQKETAQEPNVGDDLGVYRLEALAGEGGMGRVFRAVHKKLGRHVALKLLRRRYASRPDAIARFFQEARAVNVIRHAGIVEITDFVEGPPGGDSYYLMEWLDGETLEARLARSRSMPLDETILIARQVAAALGAAHRAGFVHRDLKPENVFLVSDDGERKAKILDFGVALLQGTNDGAVAGTPAYFSPEGAAGRSVDARSDIYSLGVMMYRMLAGALPFEADSLSGFVMKHMTARPRALTEAAPSVPAPLGAVVDRCLKKQPDERFQSMAELADALGALSTAAPTPRKRAILVGGVAAGAIAVVAVLALALHRTPASSPTVAAVPARAPIAEPAVAQPPGDDGRVEVSIASTPSGAEVYHDGAVLGRTPCMVRVPRATPGIELRLDGYHAAATVVDGTMAHQSIDLTLQSIARHVHSAHTTHSHSPSKKVKNKTATVDPFKR